MVVVPAGTSNERGVHGAAVEGAVMGRRTQRRSTRHVVDGTDGKGPMRRILDVQKDGGWGDDCMTWAVLECGHVKGYLGTRKLGKRARCTACGAGKPVDLYRGGMGLWSADTIRFLVAEATPVPEVMCVAYTMTEPARARHGQAWCALLPSAELDPDAVQDPTACGHTVTMRAGSEVRQPTCGACRRALQYLAHGWPDPVQERARFKPETRAGDPSVKASGHVCSTTRAPDNDRPKNEGRGERQESEPKVSLRPNQRPRMRPSRKRARTKPANRGR